VQKFTAEDELAAVDPVHFGKVFCVHAAPFIQMACDLGGARQRPTDAGNGVAVLLRNELAAWICRAESGRYHACICWQVSRMQVVACIIAHSWPDRLPE
jgi:hypothetical protein